MPRGNAGRDAGSKDLWRKLDQAALEGLRAGNGVLTIDRTDRSQRNLFLSLERLVGVGTVSRTQVEGPFVTYRLPPEAGRSPDLAKGAGGESDNEVGGR